MTIEPFLELLTACLMGGAIALFVTNVFDHIVDGIEEADDEYL